MHSRRYGIGDEFHWTLIVECTKHRAFRPTKPNNSIQLTVNSVHLNAFDCLHGCSIENCLFTLRLFVSPFSGAIQIFVHLIQITFLSFLRFFAALAWFSVYVFLFRMGANLMLNYEVCVLHFLTFQTVSWKMLSAKGRQKFIGSTFYLLFWRCFPRDESNVHSVFAHTTDMRQSFLSINWVVEAPFCAIWLVITMNFEIFELYITLCLCLYSNVHDAPSGGSFQSSHRHFWNDENWDGIKLNANKCILYRRAADRIRFVILIFEYKTQSANGDSSILLRNK